jgi:hypothetical protein
VFIGRVAVAAVRVNVAVAVPELAAEAVNVVELHPLVEGVARDERVKSGNFREIVSDAARGAFSANRKETDEAADVAAVAIVRTLVESTGAESAVDVVIADAAMFDAPANVTAAVRVLRLALCAAVLVVIPDAIITTHSAPELREAVAAVNVTVAVAVPELLFEAVNVVEPQPLVVGVARVAKAKLGSTKEIVSPVLSSTSNANMKEIDDAADVIGFAMVRALCVNEG